MSPSIKTLCLVTNDSDKACELRELLTNERNASDYKSVAELDAQSYGRQSYVKRVLTAANEICGTCGVEFAEYGNNSADCQTPDARSFWYLNTGDGYQLTLVYRNGRFSVARPATIIEKWGN